MHKDLLKSIRYDHHLHHHLIRIIHFANLLYNCYCIPQTAGAPITPEERHVANMQINGYENPTYKYFEVKE